MPSGKAKESRAFQSPSRYIQGPGELRNLPAFAANYGPTALAIIDTFFYPEYSVKIPELFQAAGMTAWTVEFSGGLLRRSAGAAHRLLSYAFLRSPIPSSASAADRPATSTRPWAPPSGRPFSAFPQL